SAADLSGDTEGEAVVVGHEHRADPAPVAQTEDELSAAVLGGGDALGLRDVNGGPLGEPGAEVLREITHRVEVEDTLAIDPRRELAPAVPRRAQLDREIFELARQETDEIHRLAPPAAARTATFIAGRITRAIAREFSTTAATDPWITRCVREIVDGFSAR